MSEALPYIVLAGSVAAVFVGIGIKIALEGASEESVLSVEVPASVAGEASVAHEVPPATSEEPSAPIAEEGEVKSSREVMELEGSVGSDGGEGEVVAAVRGGFKRRRKRRKVGKRLERKIVRLYRKGKSPKEIAEELGISTSTVYRKLRKLMSVKS